MALPSISPDDYRSLLARLLPPGRIWRAAVGGEVGRWFHAFATEFARLHLRIATLVEESDPRTTVEMLAAWERNAGLPELCAPAGQTDDERRAALTARIAARGGQSPAYFIAVAAALGLTVTIDEFAPFVVESSCGDPICDDAWRFAWQVNAPKGPLVYAVAEAAAAGDALESEGQPALECTIRTLRPAHTFVLFAYT